MAICCVYMNPYSAYRYRECNSQNICAFHNGDYILQSSFNVNDCADCLKGFMQDDEIETLINQNKADPNILLRTKEYIMVEDLHFYPENNNTRVDLGLCFVFWVNGSVSIIPVSSGSNCNSWLESPDVKRVEFRNISFT